MPRKNNTIVKTFTFEGKRYSVSGKTEAEATSKLAIKKHELEEGKKILSPTSLTVKQWAEICIEEYKNNVTELTLKGYKYKMNRWIISNIGTMKLRSVKPLHCQNIMNSMKDCATDTQRKVKQLLNFIFEKAVQNNLIYENPAKYLTIITGKVNKRRAITQYEREMILKVADTDPKYNYFLFMLYCGCRPSEVAEIKQNDIITTDSGKNMLHIRGTKTKNADRTVPIPDYLYKRLPHEKGFDYLFKNGNNVKLTLSNRQDLWKAFKRQLNIAMGCEVYRNQVIPPYRVAEDLVPYCLRHTYCTDLEKQGIDIRTAQYLMGHYDITLTANIYTHTDMETLEKVSDIMNNSTASVVPTVVPMRETIENTI